MATYGPHGLVIPEYLTSANGPDAFQRFAESIEPGLYGTAVDEADRDTRYAAIPLGGLVVSHEVRAVWMRVPGGWQILAEDTGWVTTGFTASDNFSLGNYQQVRRANGYVSLNIHVYRTNGTLSGGNNGNVTDTKMVRIPAQYAPGSRNHHVAYRATGTSGSCRIDSDGLITILDMHSNATIAEDHGVIVDAVYPAKDA